MAVEAAGAGVDLTPTSPLGPGPLLTIAADGIELDVAAAAGGRIAQIRCDGVDQLLAWGAHDRVIDPSAMDLYADKMPQARKVLFDGSGHMAVMEQPDEVADAIEGLLAAPVKQGARA